MMFVIAKYNLDINEKVICDNINRLMNKTFRLLPTREEQGDWKSSLSSILEEVSGMYNLIGKDSSSFLSLISKMEGLFALDNEEDYSLYRKTIFECMTLYKQIQDYVLINIE